MEIDANLLLRALCLMLVLEGILPFLSPQMCKRAWAKLVQTDAMVLRVSGGMAMFGGLWALTLFSG